MPEGPEIRRAADRIAKVLAGVQIEQARFGLQRLRRFEDELRDRRVERVDTRGKALLIRFEGGRVASIRTAGYGYREKK